MRVLITGAAGMIGRKLTARLVKQATLRGKPIDAVVLHDIIDTPLPAGSSMAFSNHTGDLSDPQVSTRLIADRPAVIFHLAAAVSGECEQDFDLGYRVNLDGTRNLFEAIRAVDGYTPRVVFTSSDAVYGGPFPEIVDDDFQQVPLSSYGTQKLIAELLLNDYTRKGFLDGVGIRLCTICVRPGKPNKAASGFFSGIIREPLVGMEAILPVSPDVVSTCASPRSAVGFLVHGAEVDGGRIGARRSLTMPGVVVSVAEQIDALRRVAGETAVKLIRHEPDEAIWSMVKDWPSICDAARARDLGFKAESRFDEIIQAHIDDELGGKIAS